MREVTLGLLLASGVGGGIFFWPMPDAPAATAAAGVTGAYALTAAEAVQRLSTAPTKTGTPPFYNQDLMVAAAGTDYVKFMTKDGTALCRVGIIPLEGGVKVAPSCGETSEVATIEGVGPDAIGGTARELQQSAFAEFVDAALDGRPFDTALVQARTIGTVVNNLSAMQDQALATQRMVEEMEADIEADERKSTAYYSAGAPK